MNLLLFCFLFDKSCAMTCVAMALCGVNLTINNNISTPLTLNQWLMNNNGYECLDGDCNNLVIPIIDNLTQNDFIYNYTKSVLAMPSMYDIRRGLDAQDTVFIAHNPILHHFVLATIPSWNNDSFQVLDPYFNATYYNLTQSDGFIVYSIYGIARQYPLFLQCNNSWGNFVMGEDGYTICEVGCLMSSVAMALRGYNIPIAMNNESQTATPYSLNEWLQANNGYAAGTSDLNETSLNYLSNDDRVIWPSDGMHTSNDLSLETVRSYVQDKPHRVIIANVMQGKHFVLIVDVLDDNDTLIVNDPGNFTNEYSYSVDVVGYRIFDMS